jgi:hypothetical protein
MMTIYSTATFDVGLALVDILGVSVKASTSLLLLSMSQHRRHKQPEQKLQNFTMHPPAKRMAPPPVALTRTSLLLPSLSQQRCRPLAWMKSMQSWMRAVSNLTKCMRPAAVTRQHNVLMSCPGT